jgi:hypothetical protein
MLGDSWFIIISWTCYTSIGMGSVYEITDGFNSHLSWQKLCATLNTVSPLLYYFCFF